MLYLTTQNRCIRKSGIKSLKPVLWPPETGEVQVETDFDIGVSLRSLFTAIGKKLFFFERVGLGCALVVVVGLECTGAARRRRAWVRGVPVDGRSCGFAACLRPWSAEYTPYKKCLSFGFCLTCLVLTVSLLPHYCSPPLTSSSPQKRLSPPAQLLNLTWQCLTDLLHLSNTAFLKKIAKKIKLYLVKLRDFLVSSNI